MTKKIRVVLAENHEMVREGLRALLQAERQISVVGETGDGLRALRLVSELKPDVLMTELIMPGLNGLEITRQVRRQSLGTRVIICTMYQEERRARAAFENGATGYVLKSDSAADLIKAIRQAKTGQCYLSPSLRDRVSPAGLLPIPAGPLTSDKTLTTREREVLQMSAEGRALADIASRLSISPRTAETHRANLMRKLGFRTQTDLIRYAIIDGILPPWTTSAIPLELGGRSNSVGTRRGKMPS
jgi:DNA-binding NarL/FixJ family response regulator